MSVQEVHSMRMSGATGLEARTDGRTARAVRTRDSVVEAILYLLGEGNLRPTAKQVSERADVSLRSVFQHFEDLEELFAAAADRQIERLAGMVDRIDPDAPFGERLERFVASRCRLLETISPVRRAALLQEPFSGEIARRLRWNRGANREELAQVFQAELEALDGRAEVLAALHVVTEWHAWETLRVHDGLSEESARRVMALAIRSLLRKE